jgi:dihydroorotate dehydrogenase electron transfer subunit
MPVEPLRSTVSAAVLSLEDLGSGYRRLRLAAPAAAEAAAPGQFVHVRVPGLDASAMRRPISVCDADPASGTLTLLFKVVGRGTVALAAVREGDRIDLMGPLGRGFPLPPEGAAVLLVGGGYGVAPLYFLARTVLSRAGGVHLFAGGRTASDLLLLDDFRALGVDVRPATDDGSLGAKGLVTVPLDAFLDARGGVPDPATPPPVLYACGPGPMLRAIDERAQARGLKAWLSLDRRMLCGVGACLGCTQTVRDGDAVATARVCADGPVFPQGRIVWE